MAQEIPFYTINAFTDGSLFLGNPAAVFILENTLETEVLQSIACDLNLPATVFYFPHQNNLVRWFAGYSEIPLCGHGSIALAHVLFHEFETSRKEIKFTTFFNDELIVQKSSDFIQLELPLLKCFETELTNKKEVEELLGMNVLHYFKGAREVLVVEDVDALVSLEPNFKILNALFSKGIGITAWRGNDRVDIVSRVFHTGVPDNEDPVTGSMHSAFTHVWSQLKNKTNFAALQASKRGGMLYTQLNESTVTLSAKAKTSYRGLYILD